MDAVTLLIADSDENFRNALTLALQDTYYIRTCSTGIQALQLLRSSAVHILVVDLMLPEMDGLTLLETLTRENICPLVLVVTPDLPFQLRSRLTELDIRYFLRKPCNLWMAIAQIEQLRRELEVQNLVQKRIQRIFLQLKIRLSLDGAGYMLFVLPALVENSKLTITKDLYHDTAKACGCRTDTVEHSIRIAIEAGWKTGPKEIWKQYFPNCTKRPSNGMFMRAIADEVRKNLE